MSRSFWAVYTPFAVLAFIVGWMVGGPKAKPVVPVAAASAATSAPSPAKADPGGDGREALKSRLTAALDQVEASPCDVAARAAFLDAYADRSGAIADDANSGDGDRPAAWNTDADRQADQRIDHLIQAGYFTQDETGMAVVRKRLGAPGMGAPGMAAAVRGGPPGAGPRRSNRCPASPAAG